jgi:mRNA-degrading endonuclease toxin of MazEF toxin-antitoxin module
VPPQRGRIVLAWVLDPKGRNLKCRPLVIVSDPKDINPGGSFLAVAITGTFPKPLTGEYVELPWHRDKKVSKTGLTKPCVAKCDWVEAITEADIAEYRGRVPSTTMQLILEKVEALGPTKPPPPGPQSEE